MFYAKNKEMLLSMKRSTLYNNVPEVLPDGTGSMFVCHSIAFLNLYYSTIFRDNSSIVYGENVSGVEISARLLLCK